MKPLATIFAALAAAPLLGSAIAAGAMAADEQTKKRHRMHDWRSLDGLPDDPGLPALAAIRASSVAKTIPALGLDGRSTEVTLCGYTAGRRATLQVRTGDRRIAVKAYSESPELEALLYAALSGGYGGLHVPRLLAWDPQLRVVALEWLDGPSLSSRIEDGQGRRAGELAAAWVRRAAELPVRFGSHHAVEGLLAKAYKWADGLGATDRALGTAAAAVARRLVATRPVESGSQLVHGSLYDRHILDLGDGPGLIDWDCFGQGAPELDAAVFLAGVWRRGLRPKWEDASAQTTEAFLACAKGLLNERALAWYQAVTLLRLAHKKLRRLEDDAVAAAQPLLAEAARLAAAAG